MINTIFNLVDLLMTIGATVSGLYLLIFTFASLRKSKLRFPDAEGYTRFMVLLPEGSELDEQDYPEELFSVEHYTDLVESVQSADISQFDMFVILGDTTHVSAKLLKYINDAHYGSARAIQLNHIVDGKLSLSEKTRAIYEGIHLSVMGLGHNRMDWPSAISRTDIAIDAQWLKANLFDEKSNIENRLLHQGVFIHYLPYACVHSNAPRRKPARTAVVKKLFKTLPTVLAEGNIYYADKLLRGVFPSWRNQLCFIVLWMVVSAFVRWNTAIRWLVVLSVYLVLIAMAAPDYLVSRKKTKKRKRKKNKENKKN